MTLPYVDVRHVSKAFGRFKALDDVSFTIERGEFVCFLGPSGCGKTTLLRCIAGLELQTNGVIVQDGTDISWRPPSQRDFGIVFQSYALFPNLSVAENVAFGLVNAGVAQAPLRARVDELLGLVGLRGQESKFPAQLSGGQQQRVALARALAPSPGLLLLDEPLSALDAKVRAHLRREIRELQKRLGVTTIMVTHDQEEAQTMADRIVVMNEGRVEQVGTPTEVYDTPATAFVADFIGVMNFVDATVTDAGQVQIGDRALAVDTGGWARGTAVRCAIRPEHVQVHRGGGAPGSPTSEPPAGGFPARVTACETLGSFLRVYVRLESTGDELTADLRRAQDGIDDPAVGEAVSVHLDAARVLLFSRSS